MSNAIYIIAYHGNDPEETRQKRSDNHNKHCWLLKHMYKQEKNNDSDL
jgi:hypothetical protein